MAPAGRVNVSGHVYHLYHPAVTEELRRMLGTAGAGPADFARQPTDTPGYFELVPVDEAGSNSGE